MTGSRPMLGEMSIAITGGTGFLGAHLVSWLSRMERPPKIRTLSRRRVAGHDCRIVNMLNETNLRAGLEGCDAVVHCAFDFIDMDSNVPMSEALGLAAAALGVRLILISTAAVHEPFPNGDLDETHAPSPGGSRYKAVKLAVEARLCELARDQGLDLVILQPTVIYGPECGAWTDSPIRELLTGTVILPDAGRGYCNAVYVGDVCQAITAALTAHVASGERVLVSGPKPVSWREFFEAYCGILKVGTLRLAPPEDGQIRRHDKGIADLDSSRPASRLSGVKKLVIRTLGTKVSSRLNLWVSLLRCLVLGGKIHLPVGAKRALFESRCNIRIDKAKRVLGYQPRFSLPDGMAETSPYIKATYGRLSILSRQRL